MNIINAFMAMVSITVGVFIWPVSHAMAFVNFFACAINLVAIAWPE